MFEMSGSIARGESFEGRMEWMRLLKSGIGFHQGFGSPVVFVHMGSLAVGRGLGLLDWAQLIA